MFSVSNDGCQFLIGLALRCGGALAEAMHRVRIARHGPSRSRLRRRLGIGRDTPLTSRVAELGDQSNRSSRIAQTSGTSGEPKRVAYSRRRLAAVRWVFVDSFLRAYRALRVRRTSLYVFGPLDDDGSLSGLLLTEGGRPSYLSTLQAPYRIHATPELRLLRATYGAAAVRLWVLALSNPGVLYSTNPSTLSAFFDQLEDDWQRCTALVRDWTGRSTGMETDLLRVARRLASRGYRERLQRIAASPGSLPITAWAPAVQVYVCWTGGYVAPFLERLERHLPAARFRRIPMYSMSTETIETIPDFRCAETAFLPAALGVYCEFLEAGGPREAARLLPPDRLRVGAVYELVASNGYGLRRYCTDDLFRVERFVGGLPDLRFMRRRGLAYSFTGEKLTGVHVSLAFERLRSEFSRHLAGHALTCFPSRRPASELPCYRLVVVQAGQGRASSGSGLAERFDRLLGEANGEYRAKRRSGRLGGVRLERVTLRELRARLPDGGAAGLDSQFKFLPLYPRLWEDSGID